MIPVANVTTGLVAQREEIVTLRHGVTKPGFVLPRSTPNGPVPREEGGSGAVPCVSTDDSPNIRDGVVECPEDGHVRPLVGMQHQVPATCFFEFDLDSGSSAPHHVRTRGRGAGG